MQKVCKFWQCYFVFCFIKDIFVLQKVIILLAMVTLVHCGGFIHAASKRTNQLDDDMQFLQIRVRKDGKPVGIFFRKPMKRQNKCRYSRSVKPDEIIEITGVRERDNEHDKKNIYRNAQIVNNTLVPYPLNYRPHKMEKSHAIKLAFP